MKLNRREAEIMDFLLQGESGMGKAADALKMKKSNLANYAKKLLFYGLISARSEGRRKMLALDGATARAFLALRQDFPSLSMADILIGMAPFLLSFIMERSNLRVEEMDLPPATAKRLLSRLRSTGILFMEKRGVYRLREQAEKVAGFCMETLVKMDFAEAEAGLGKVQYALHSFGSAKELGAVFVTGRECQMKKSEKDFFSICNEPKRITNTIKKYWPTAYSAAHIYGLQLLQAGKFYYSNSKPDIGDIALHILALSKDARGVLYASALLVKNKYAPLRLLKKRQAFGLERRYLEAFARFIKSKGKEMPDGFPGYAEVEAVLR